jgi:hypothetical protein
MYGLKLKAFMTGLVTAMVDMTKFLQPSMPITNVGWPHSQGTGSEQNTCQAAVHIINPVLAACVSVYISLLLLLGKGSVKCIPRFVARQWLSKQVPVTTNACKNRIVGHVCLCIPLSLPGNNSVKMFPQQWIIVGGTVFCSPCYIKGK